MKMNRPRLVIRLLGISFLISGCNGGGSKNKFSLGTTVQDVENETARHESQEQEEAEKASKQGALDQEAAAEPGATDATVLSCSDKPQGRSYKGFGGGELAAGREDKMPALGNRYRVKPFVALSSEIKRVFGTEPRSLVASASTFPSAEPRWYVEPIASGVTVFTTFRVAYDGALALAATEPLMAAAPQEATAAEFCKKYAELAWMRPPTDAEVTKCSKVALELTSAEMDPKSRWSYTLGSLLTASDFVSY